MAGQDMCFICLIPYQYSALLLPNSSSKKNLDFRDVNTPGSRYLIIAEKREP